MPDRTERQRTMTYRGTVKGGVVVLDGAQLPPDGTVVQVVVDEVPLPTWKDVFQDVIGIAPELPEDIAENHDHYIHGTAKRIDRP